MATAPSTQLAPVLADPWLAIRAAAVYAGVCPETLRRAVRAGRLKATKISHRYLRIRRSAIDTWLAGGDDAAS